MKSLPPPPTFAWGGVGRSKLFVFCVLYGYLLRRSTRDDESIIVFALFSPNLRRSSTTLTLCPSLEEARLPDRRRGGRLLPGWLAGVLGEGDVLLHVWLLF